MNPIPIISNQYPIATLTNFKDNVRSGVIQFPGGNANSPGVMVGNLQAYAIKPIASGAIFSPIVNPNGYITFTGNVLSPFAVTDSKITFDVCRGLKITTASTDGFTWKVSGTDFYDEKMVWSGTTVSGTEVLSPRGFNSICSVSITQADGDTGTFTISTRDSIELPYADWNADNVIIVNYDENPLMWLEPSDITSYSTSFAFDYRFSNAIQTGDSGRPRPQLTLDPTTYTGTPPFDGTKVLTVVQAVIGAGFNIPPTDKITVPSVEQNSQPYLNDKEYVIGTKSYSEGWQEFIS